MAIATQTTTKVAVPKYGSTNPDGSINRFDPNTGKSLAPSGSSLGKTYTDTQGQQFYSSDLAKASSQKYVKASDIQPTTELTIPEKKPYTDYTGLIQGANLTQTNPELGVIGTAKGITVKPPENNVDLAEQANQTSMDRLKQLIGILPQRENVQESIMKSQQYRQVEEARQQVQNYTNQLNAIQTKLQADQLSVTGQGRGIPEAIIGGQQAQLSKEAAIQSLPIQALLASSQGMMDIAQRHLDDLYKLKTEEVNNNYAYQSKVFDSISGFLTTSDQRTYDAARADLAQKQKKDNDFLDLQAKLLSNAVSRGAPQSYVTAINNTPLGDTNGLVRAAGKYNIDAQDAASIANTNSLINERARTSIQQPGVLTSVTGEALKPAEAIAYGYGTRALASSQIIDGLEQKFANKPNLSFGITKLQSADRQSLEQAERDFINAVLRKESGASIQKDEFNNAKKQYIPSYGDTKETLAQKAANRQSKIQGLLLEAGQGSVNLSGLIIAPDGSLVRIK